MKMRFIIFYFLLISSFAQAQINYSYFKQTWCKCLPDSGVVNTDTSTYRIESETCKTKRYSETHVFTEQLEYTFEKRNNGTIYESNGNSLRKDYVKKMNIEITYKTNTIGDTIGVDSTYNVIHYSPGSSSATLRYSTYQLNKSKNRLTIFYGKERNEYKILFLSSKLLLMRKIE